MIKATLSDLQLEYWLRHRNDIIWVTKDKKEIPITEMSDSHLLNAIHKFSEEDNGPDIGDWINIF